MNFNMNPSPKDFVYVDKNNHIQQTNLTIRACEVLLEHEDVLSIGEINFVNDLIRFLTVEVNCYASIGTSEEKPYWEKMQKEIMEKLPNM